ncbi:transcriptional regulator, TetR family [Aeromicrobium marinum DSM 15272]|uniref:Transcriptional regulator, TetR family n=1 Tax=Aeromicrobium marinum DSM 15272 TaxID=585531 RepID=E2S9C4_9ACTN|nr:TetR/AcrR family transcriptional regulator [Aeromicrobium marinum]EFQ83848.1 transcriptional regulator, TetR family [Aeromicrobium marinum DSM 15272]
MPPASAGTVRDAVRHRLEPETRQRQIIEAARGLYAERPYDEISMTELAAAAGVARGLINHYFGSKRELFLAVMRDSISMPERELPEMEGLDLPARVRLTIDWILEAAATYGHAWVSVSGAVNLHGSDDLQAVVDEADDRAARLTLDALGLPDDAHLRARLRPIAALTKAVCREWLQRGTMTRDEALDLLSDTVILVVGKDRQ